jgi:hypothetical protein
MNGVRGLTRPGTRELGALLKKEGAALSSSLRKISEKLQNSLRTFPASHAYSSLTQRTGAHTRGKRRFKDVTPQPDGTQI